jgi:hypothetical protein
MNTIGFLSASKNKNVKVWGLANRGSSTSKTVCRNILIYNFVLVLVCRILF